MGTSKYIIPLQLTLLAVIPPPSCGTHAGSRHRITGAPVTTVTLVLTPLPEGPQGTGLGAVHPCPACWTLALPGHMVTLCTIVPTVTDPLTVHAEKSLGAGLVTMLPLPAFVTGAPSSNMITRCSVSTAAFFFTACSICAWLTHYTMHKHRQHKHLCIIPLYMFNCIFCIVNTLNKLNIIMQSLYWNWSGQCVLTFITAYTLPAWSTDTLPRNVVTLCPVLTGTPVDTVWSIRPRGAHWKGTNSWITGYTVISSKFFRAYFYGFPFFL